MVFFSIVAIVTLLFCGWFWLFCWVSLSFMRSRALIGAIFCFFFVLVTYSTSIFSYKNWKWKILQLNFCRLCDSFSAAFFLPCFTVRNRFLCCLLSGLSACLCVCCGSHLRSLLCIPLLFVFRLCFSMHYREVTRFSRTEYGKWNTKRGQKSQGDAVVAISYNAWSSSPSISLSLASSIVRPIPNWSATERGLFEVEMLSQHTHIRSLHEKRLW